MWWRWQIATARRFLHYSLLWVCLLCKTSLHLHSSCSVPGKCWKEIFFTYLLNTVKERKALVCSFLQNVMNLFCPISSWLSTTFCLAVTDTNIPCSLQLFFGTEKGKKFSYTPVLNFTHYSIYETNFHAVSLEQNTDHLHLCYLYV